MKGIILTNPYFDFPAAHAQARRLHEEFAKRGLNVPIVPNGTALSYIDRTGRAKSDACDLTFAVYLDKDKYQAPLLESLGVRLFNSSRAIELCDDKMSCAIALSSAGLPVPRTIPAPLCFSPDKSVALSTIERIESLLDYPIIVKESYGSLGEGVYLARDRSALLNLSSSLKMKPHLYQEAITSSFGRDIRVITIGGEAICAMERINDHDFRANIARGGVGQEIDITPEVGEMAKRASCVLGLDYAGVDILFGKNDEPILCEVNSNAFFDGIEHATGKNIAHLYVEHILRSVS